MSGQSEGRDLSWQQRPTGELLRLAWPTAVSMLSYSTMTLVDTLFVGRLGPAALAGVGLGGVSTWALLCFSIGLLRGAKVMVAQAVGAGNNDEVHAVKAAMLVYALLLGALTVALAQPAAGLLPALSASSAAGRAAAEYLALRSVGAPVVLLFWGLREVRQGLGDTRTPMLASVCANVANAGLDYLLIFGLDLGVAGAALASVLAAVVELAVLLSLWRGALQAHGLRTRHLAGLWWLGWPSGLELLVEMGSFTALSVMIARHSELHMAAHQVALQLVHFSFLPAFALADAVCVLAGQAVGAGRDPLVRRVARSGLVLGAIYTGACSLLFALGGQLLARAFSDSEPLALVVARLLLVAAVFQVFDAAATVARSALRGTGDVRFPAVAGALAAWLLTPPSMWLWGYRLGLGAVGGWLGLCAELVLAAALFWWRLERGGWRAAAARARSLRAELPPAPVVEGA